MGNSLNERTRGIDPINDGHVTSFLNFAFSFHTSVGENPHPMCGFLQRYRDVS